MTVEPHRIVRADPRPAHGGDHGALHVVRRPGHGLQIGQEILRVGAAQAPVGGARHDHDPRARAIGVHGAHDSDDAAGGVIVLRLERVAVADDVCGRAQRPAQRRPVRHPLRRGAVGPGQSGHVGAPRHRVLGGRRNGDGGTAAHGDGGAGRIAIALGGDPRGEHGHVVGDALHRGQRRGGDHPAPIGHDLGGELPADLGVEPLRDAGQVGLDGSPLATRFRGPGVVHQDRDRHQVLPHPLGQVGVGHDDGEIVQDVGEVAVGVHGQTGVRHGLAGTEQEEEPRGRGRPHEEAQRAPGGRAERAESGASAGPRRGGGAGLGSVVDANAGRDIGGESAQGVGRVLEGADARRQRRGGVDRAGAQRLEAGRLPPRVP